MPKQLFRHGDGRKKGRPPGVPNKSTREIKAFAREHLFDDPAYVKNLMKRIFRGEADHMEKWLADHGYGKPVERAEVGGPGDFARLTDAELDAALQDAIASLDPKERGALLKLAEMKTSGTH